MKNKTILFIIWIFFLSFSEGTAFELKYLHNSGDNIKYKLEIYKKNQKTLIDIYRYIDRNENSIIITTSFDNAQIIIGGIPQYLDTLNGQVNKTIMDEYGVISDIQPLSSFNSINASLDVNIQRDIMNSLGISSFPKEDLSVGSSWTKNASKGNLNSTFFFKIEKENISYKGYNSVVEISITSDLIIDNESEIVEVQNTTFTNGKILIRGILYFDLTKGRIVKIDQRIKYHIVSIVLDFNGVPFISADEDEVVSILDIQ